MSRRLVLAAGLGLLPIASGCVLYDPALVDRDAPTCSLRRPPARPATMDEDDGPEVSFGLRQVRLMQGGEWRNIGYDIDGFCTEAPDRLNECDIGDPAPADGNDGIDNVFGESLYPLVGVAVVGLEEMAVAAQEEGRGLPILRIRQWNGTPNDPQIEVVIAQGVFGTSAEAPGGGPPAVTINSPTDFTLADGSPVPLPAWDGDDYLWLRADAFLEGNPERPLIVDRTAYIVDGEFVARLPDGVDIIFPTDTIGVLVRLTDAVATGRLSSDGMTLDPVTVAGRWRVTDLLDTAQNIGLCPGSAFYDALALRLEDIADVLGQPPDPGDPIVDCDAISIGVTFVGTRANLATTTPGLPLANVCEKTGGDVGTGLDAGPVDSGTPDAGMDAGMDAGVDAGMDAGDEEDTD